MAEDTGIPGTYWRSQLYVALWPLWLTWSLVAIYSINFYENLVYLGFPVFVLVGLGMFVSTIGFIFDGLAIRRSAEYDWQPRWYVYFVASLFVGPFFVAPVYLYRRHKKINEPTMNDVKRKFSVKGSLLPWY